MFDEIFVRNRSLNAGFPNGGGSDWATAADVAGRNRSLPDEVLERRRVV